MLSLHSHASISDIAASDWDAMVDDYPFGRHAFLQALEDSHSVGGDTGWIPQPLTLHDSDTLIAVIPAYIKQHSYGEYVFDWAWADAYDRYNLPYYPKLVIAIPFTPCQGSRIFSKHKLSQTQYRALFHALHQLCENQQLSGCHALFTTQVESEAFSSAQWLYRRGMQYHWFNHDYHCFDDFLQRCTSRKRKELKKERKHVAEQGFRFHQKEGTALSPQDWQLFYTLYCNTYLKRSGHTGYLTAKFFEQIGHHLPEHIMMVTAEAEGTIVAAALNFKNDRTLYGRYWGCLAEFDKLHFETCYYQGIDYCIKHGLQKFDAGAQGEHKIQRGFEPIDTHSNHWLVRPDFKVAIERFLDEESQLLGEHKQALTQKLPFKTPIPR